MVKPIYYWSITSQVLKEEAEKLGFEVEILVPEKNLFIVRGNGKEILFKNNDFGGNSSLAKKIVDDKQLSHVFLEREGFPIPKTWYITKDTVQSFDWSKLELYYPLIIKPVSEAHGDGVKVHIKSVEELQKKLLESFESYNMMIIQQMIIGDECRIIVLFHEVILAVIRKPPYVIGDGLHTISELIEQENESNPFRGKSYHSPLSEILLDNELIDYIGKSGYKIDDILELGTSLQVRGNSNVGTGGTLHEITHILHPDIITQCIQISKSLNMQLLCLDIMSSDFSRPLRETNGVILEIGGNPGFGGDRELTSVNTGRLLLEKLFYRDNASR